MQLNTWAPQLLQKMRALPQLRQVNTDQQDKGLGSRMSSSIVTRLRGWASPRRTSIACSTTLLDSVSFRLSTNR